MSRLNVFVRFILNVPYHDLTAGFKCFRREVLARMNLDALSSIGYNFQIETTYLAHRLGFRIRELPICFTERKLGTSKFNIPIIFESFIRVALLRFRRTPRPAK